MNNIINNFLVYVYGGKKIKQIVDVRIFRLMGYIYNFGVLFIIENGNKKKIHIYIYISIVYTYI